MTPRTVLTLIPTLTFLLLALFGHPTRAVADQAALLITAHALETDYEDLITRIDACEDGQCSGAPAILEDLDDAEVERQQLHADRATLGTCSCQTLDAVIGSIDGLAAEALQKTVNWEETCPAADRDERAPAEAPAYPATLVRDRRDGSGKLPRQPVLEANGRALDGQARGEDAAPRAQHRP